MSMQDKAEHKGEELKGAVKEGLGKLTNDTSMEVEGKLEKTAGKAKGKADEIRDDLSDKRAEKDY
jgi:uncharacterized protein YjbJ (UPF0337 family)